MVWYTWNYISGYARLFFSIGSVAIIEAPIMLRAHTLVRSPYKCGDDTIRKVTVSADSLMN